MLTEETKKPIRAGVLPVSIELLEQMFCLPEGYKIVGASFRRTQTGRAFIRFVLESDAFPQMQEGVDSPQLELHACVEYLSDHPGYRRFSTDVHLVENMR